VVGKTGTSNDNHDAYFLGGTRDYVIASWMGYDKPMGLGMSTRTGKEIQGASLVPLFVKMVSELPGNVKTSVAPSPPPNVLRVASVPALFADGNVRPRCATPEDPAEQVAEHYYLRTAVPELCPPEIASQPQITPLGFSSAPSLAAGALLEEARKPPVALPTAPLTSTLPDLGMVSEQSAEDEDRPWRSTPKIEE
jgi:membrane peptidoglycan carboxypeptidase